METFPFECRVCKKVTDQVERVVTDLLPPGIKTLECGECGSLGVCLVGDRVA
jgi:hypothetical protein